MTSKNPLECWRVEKSLSVMAAAGVFGVSRKTWWEWISGKSTPSDRSSTRIQCQTGITRSELVAWQESALQSRATGCEVAS